MRFINLKVHSIYSVFRGTTNARAIAAKAASLRHSAECLTNCTLCGALEFSISCLELTLSLQSGCDVLLNFEDSLAINSKQLRVHQSISINQRKWNCWWCVHYEIWNV
ncbi:MAG: PHP domain-containing protein [Candidatus Hodgkinia cicadicola]